MGIEPQISVMLTSYNHAAFVGEQVESILAQTWQNWHLTISDNASSDGSWELLRRYEAAHPDRITLVHGPTYHGLREVNQFNLAARVAESADYYVLCHSDDVCLPDRLERSVRALEPLGQGEAAVYASRLALIDADGRELGLNDTRDLRPPSFGNAFVQCVTSEPSLAFNQPALRFFSMEPGHARGPDIWAYLITTGVGGHVVYDPKPTVLYRQHKANYLGPNRGLKGKAKRLRLLLNGSYHDWLEMELSLLSANEGLLTPENRGKLAAMLSVHRGEGGPLDRLKKMRMAGARRQKPLETAFCYTMGMLKLL